MVSEKSILVETSRVSCDGGGGPLGHPKVSLEIGDNGQVVCPYCSNRFELDGESNRASDH